MSDNQHGRPSELQDVVKGSWPSLSRFKSSYEFVRSIAHAMEGKEAHPMTTFCFEYTFCLLQRMMVLSLMPVFFIVISVQGISLSRLKGKVC